MPSSSWSIEFYEDASGRAPAREFLKKELNPTEQASMAHRLNLLREFGLQLGTDYARQVQDKIWELRDSTSRLLYFAHTGRRSIVVHGFRKKTQKTPKREIKIAIGRWEDFLAQESK